LETEQEEQAPPSRAQTPTQPTATATPSLPQPTNASASPTTACPQFANEDGDLQELFRDVISQDCLVKNDLFRVRAVSLRAKLVAFAKKAKVKSHDERCQRFCGNKVPSSCAVKDTTTSEPDPCLHGKRNAPMSVPATSEVAQALLNLSVDVPEIFHLQKHSGSKGSGKRIIAMTPSTDKRRLHGNAKLWMHNIVDIATTDETSAFDIAHVSIRLLRAIEPLAFEDIVMTLAESETSRSRCKLDPELQQAMVHKANLGASQLRTVKQCFCCSNLDMLQPESVMKALQADEFVRPNPIEFREGKGKRKRVAWHIPADDLLVWNANQKLEANAFDCKNLDKAHIMMVGDHGQGAFRMMITMLSIARPL